MVEAVGAISGLLLFKNASYNFLLDWNYMTSLGQRIVDRDTQVMFGQSIWMWV